MSPSETSATSIAPMIGAAICRAPETSPLTSVTRARPRASHEIAGFGITCRLRERPCTTIRWPSVAKSTVTATNWCSRPKTEVWVSISGSSAMEELKPPTMSTRSPAACTAPMATSTKNPSASPVTSCTSRRSTRSHDASGGADACTAEVSGRASASASATRACIGTARVLKGGVTRTEAAVRATASTKAASSCSPTASCSPVTPASRVDQRRDEREEVVGEPLERAQRPGARQYEHERGHEQLRQERQGRLLHLRRGLHDRQRQPDHERRHEHRPGDLRRREQGLGDDLHDL